MGRRKIDPEQLKANINEYRRQYQRKRYKNDIEFREKQIATANLRYARKKQIINPEE